ncbi:MAG: hypothetical protein HY922_03545 [Elusimicrobia bacterium]|nr:hypothetical protein [Elusimicrobiota bacterium]
MPARRLHQAAEEPSVEPAEEAAQPSRPRRAMRPRVQGPGSGQASPVKASPSQSSFDAEEPAPEEEP